MKRTKFIEQSGKKIAIEFSDFKKDRSPSGNTFFKISGYFTSGITEPGLSTSYNARSNKVEIGYSYPNRLTQTDAQSFILEKIADMEEMFIKAAKSKEPENFWIESYLQDMGFVNTF